MSVVRTIVGSWPHRRTLPDGDEANARALHHARFWGTNTPEQASRAACSDFVSQHLTGRGHALWLMQRRRHPSGIHAGWLPASVHSDASRPRP